MWQLELRLSKITIIHLGSQSLLTEPGLGPRGPNSPTHVRLAQHIQSNGHGFWFLGSRRYMESGRLYESLQDA